VELFLRIYRLIQNDIQSATAFSWPTFILLSVFSCYMSLLATGFTQELIAFFGWIFFILGVNWGTTENAIKIGDIYLSPWITGALVSLFIFGQPTGEFSSEALVFWPPISAVIAAVPLSFGSPEGKTKFKMPKSDIRQKLVILFGTQFLFSCWFQFYFVIQNWLNQYPTMLLDDFTRSAFVVRVGDRDEKELPRGALMLNLMAPQLEQALEDKPWSQVERWLLREERPARIEAIAQEVKQVVAPLEEDSLWQLTSDISSSDSGYILELQAVWNGPRSQANPYVISKPCEINQVLVQPDAAIDPVDAQLSPPPEAIGEVECGAVTGWGIGDDRES
jgi:hypothetical protein